MLISAPDGGQQSASRPRLWVDRKISPGVLQNRISCPRLESNHDSSVAQPAAYRLCSPCTLPLPPVTNFSLFVTLQSLTLVYNAYKAQLSATLVKYFTITTDLNDNPFVTTKEQNNRYHRLINSRYPFHVIRRFPNTFRTYQLPSSGLSDCMYIQKDSNLNLMFVDPCITV